MCVTRLITIGLLALSAFVSILFMVYDAASLSTKVKYQWFKSFDTILGESNSVQLELILSVSEHSIHDAQETLRAISDPRSSSFGQYWSEEQILNHFSPIENLDRIISELESFGIYRRHITISASRSRVYLNLPAVQAERLFHTELNSYVRVNETQHLFQKFRIPHVLSEYVDFITLSRATAMTKNFHSGERGKRRAEDQGKLPATNCSVHTTPSCLRELYNFPYGNNKRLNPESSLGIFEAAWETWLAEDLDSFFGRFEPDFIGKRPTVQKINGGYLQTDIKIGPFNLEANLDFQVSMPLAHPVPVTNIQVGDKFLRGNINTMLGAFDEFYCETATDPAYDPVYPDDKNQGGYNASDCGRQKPPLVLSISAGQAESDLPPRYLKLQCLEMLKLALRGVTVLVASGDTGTVAAQDMSCLEGNYTGTHNTKQRSFSPVFPASCPWVTSVGGTQLSSAIKASNSVSGSAPPFPQDEEAFHRLLSNNATLLSSGGGFSDMFARPFYQARDIPAYLQTSAEASRLYSLQQQGYFNSTGRGYPDVAALAVNYPIYIDGSLHNIHGTSASTPVLASMIARINNMRLNMGKAPVGFINPVLYAFKDEITRDVLTGSNQACGNSRGFAATQGWDAVTGLGSLDYTKLVHLYSRLP